MDFKTLSESRYSLRKYSEKPVEKEKLSLIAEVIRNAPTACNYQPQRIFFLTSDEAKAKAEACLGCHFNPPVLIVVCYDKNISWVRSGDGHNFGEVDASIVATQIMLEATDLGLGTCYLGWFDAEKLVNSFPEMSGLTVTAVITLGYPQEGAHPAKLHTDRLPVDTLVKEL